MKPDQLNNLLGDLVNLPTETEWVEFKKDVIDHEQIGEIISGISNSANLLGKDFGYLVFGVADKTHEITGTKFKPKQYKIGEEEVEHWWMQRLNPKLNVCIYEFQNKGKNIVLFEIPSAIDRPVAFMNNEYIRIGSINRSLKDFPEKEKKIWQNPKNFKFEKGIAIQGINADDVLDLIHYPSYFALLNQNLPVDQETILRKLEEDDVIKKSRTRYDITNMGAILFATNINRFESIRRKTIRVVIYKGKDRINAIKEKVGQRGYAIGFKNVVEYINDQLPSNEEIGKALRIEKKMYPEIAVRELVANALIHQDFTIRGSGPLIEIFQDRIEISNPGVPLISTDRFIDHTPRSRNEDIASFMRRMNVCEERGSGIDKVIFNVEMFQLPAPKFEVTEDSTKITLLAYKELKGMGKSDKLRACYQHCCLKYVSSGEMTNTSLRERFGIKPSNYSIASRIISESIKAKLIKPKNPENLSRKHAKYLPIWA